MLEQEKRWQELSKKLQSQDDKLEIVLNNTTGNQMISQTDFRGLNFDDVLGKWLVRFFWELTLGLILLFLQNKKYNLALLLCIKWKQNPPNISSELVSFLCVCVTHACIDLLQNKSA